jgi:hypothetical protein
MPEVADVEALGVGLGAATVLAVAGSPDPHGDHAGIVLPTTRSTVPGGVDDDCCSTDPVSDRRNRTERQPRNANGGA